MQGGFLVTAFLHPKVITRLSRNKNEILIKKESYYCFEIAHNVLQYGMAGFASAFLSTDKKA